MRDAGDGLCSARLQLRRFTPDDLDYLQQLYSDEDVARYVGGVKTRAQSQEMLDQRILSYYPGNPGLGVWVTMERDSGTPVGMHLLSHIRGESLIQVGYLLLPQFWGRGYASEMCHALLQYGFAERGLERIVAITDPRNLASQKVLLRCGLRANGLRNFDAYAQYGPQSFFERGRSEWLADQAPGNDRG